MRGKRVVLPGLAVRLIAFVIPFIPRRLLLRAVGARQSRRRSAQPA
jgi:hypothetical protein